jgi:hypothetical protein
VEIDIGNLAAARIVIDGHIDSYIKVGDPLQRNPFAHAPDFHWEISGAELLAKDGLRLELGGTELFIAVERLTEQALPVDVGGNIEVDPVNGPFGFRPVYFHGRERDDGKVWSSAQFVEFVEG